MLSPKGENHMKFLKLLLTKIWRWFVLNNDIISIKFAMHGLTSVELDLVEKCLAAGLIKDEIIYILKQRRLKSELRKLLKDSGYSDSEIDEIMKQYKDEISNLKSADEIFKKIKSINTPK